MANKIFVTASSGNVGRQIVQALTSSNADFVAGISQREEGKPFPYSTQIIDFANKKAMSGTFQGFDTLFLLVPVHPLMIDLAKNAVDAAKIAGVRHIVRSSGFGTEVLSTYKLSQIQGTIDEYVKTSGLSFTITSPNNFMQNFTNFHANDIKNGAMYMPTGSGKVSWIDISDIAAVNATILQNPSEFAGQTFDLTGSESLSYADCLAIISGAIGKTVSFVDIPEQTAIEGMKQFQMPDFVIEIMSSLNQMIKAGKAGSVTDFVKSITGKAPVLFTEFVEGNKNYWI